MPINTKHPEYINAMGHWSLMEDTYKGKVKQLGVKYLPPTEGMRLDGMGANEIGAKNYEAYKLRAVYTNHVRDCTEKNVGRIHLKHFVVELPEEMEPMRHRINAEGENIQDFLIRITTEQMYRGRLGLLLTFPSTVSQTQPLPYIALYKARAITNWHTGENNSSFNNLKMVVLDESGQTFNEDSFEWETIESFRVLRLATKGVDINGEAAPLQKPIYQYGMFQPDEDFEASKMHTISAKGKTLDAIPFVFINSKDLNPSIDESPLESLAQHSLVQYRGEADYRQTLHQQGQETLVVIGGAMQNNNSDSNEFDVSSSKTNEGGAIRTGTGSAIEVDVEGDAKYIGVSSGGLSEQRLSVKDDREIGQAMAGTVVKEGKQVESGSSISGRINSQTTTLNQIAVTNATGVEKILKLAARWLGLDESEVRVVANQDFDSQQFGTNTLESLAKAKKDGIPLSDESIHQFCKEKGFTRMEFEQELKLVEKELKVKEERLARITAMERNKSGDLDEKIATKESNGGQQ